MQPSCGNRGSPSRAGFKSLGSSLDSVLESLGLAGLLGSRSSGLWRGAVHRLSPASLDCVGNNGDG